jgi:hypothetical protein
LGFAFGGSARESGSGFGFAEFAFGGAVAVPDVFGECAVPFGASASCPALLVLGAEASASSRLSRNCS